MAKGGEVAKVHLHLMAGKRIETGVSIHGGVDVARLRAQANGLMGKQREQFAEQLLAEAGIDVEFVQENHSLSAKGTVRGLHAQLRHPQGKLLRAIQGEIFDVAVDIRRGSPHFGRWVGIRLSAENFRQLYVPPGFAHGFCVLSERVHVEYKCTEFYDRQDELAIAWNDPAIGIEWPIASPVLSAKDAAAPRLEAVAGSLPAFAP